MYMPRRPAYPLNTHPPACRLQIEKLERVCVAYQYHVAHQEVSQSDGELKEMEEEKDRYAGSRQTGVLALGLGPSRQDGCGAAVVITVGFANCCHVATCRMKAEMVELHKGVEERVKEVKQLKQLRDKDYEKAYEKVVPVRQRGALCSAHPACWAVCRLALVRVPVNRPRPRRRHSPRSSSR